MFVVGVGPEPGVEHEVGCAVEVTGSEECLLWPPDLLRRLVRLDEVSCCVQEQEPFNTVGNGRRDLKCDVPAVGGSHETEALDPQLLEQGKHRLSGAAVRAQCHGRAAVPRKVASHDRVAGEQGGHLSAPHPEVGYAGMQQQDDRPGPCTR